jgi:hypothetical protein
LNYTDGIQPFAGILDLALESGDIIQSGSWYSTKEGERLGQGRAKAEEALKEMDGIIDRLNDYISDTGYSTKSEEIAEAEAILIEEDI